MELLADNYVKILVPQGGHLEKGTIAQAIPDKVLNQEVSGLLAD